MKLGEGASYLTEPPDSAFGMPPPVRTSPQFLPLDRLDWANFERLCLRLGETDGDVDYAGIYGVPGQAQEGIDVLLRLHGGGYRLIQSRRIEKMSPAGLSGAVDAFLAGGWARKASSFVFATSASAARTEVQDELASQAARLLEHGINFDVWDEDRLSRMLKLQPDLVSDFFGMDVLRVFLPNQSDAVLGEQIVRHMTPKLDAVSDRLDVIAGRSRTGVQDASVRLRGLSRIAVEDADTISRERGLRSEEHSSVRLSQALYVTRPAEEIVLDALELDAAAVLLVGEPGTGKTSMMWRLQQRLSDAGRDAYMVRAPLLRLDGRPGPGPDRDMLIETVVAARSAGRRIAVLIDTADARLRDEAERAALLLLLDELQQARAQLVVSTRPREAAALRDVWSAELVELGVYREELQEAVRRHVERFYSAQPAGDVDSATAAVLAAAARGWPVQALLVIRCGCGCFSRRTHRSRFLTRRSTPPPSTTCSGIGGWSAICGPARRLGCPSRTKT